MPNITAEEVLQKLTELLGPAATEATVAGSEIRLSLPAEAGRKAAVRLREMGFDYLNCLSGVDWISHLEVVLDVSSLSHPLKAHLRVRVDRTQPVIPTFTEIWPAANWHERECFDLFGVQFEGHPDLRRILLPEDWVGYPLRKDYADERLVPYTDYGFEEKVGKPEKAAPKPRPAAAPAAPPAPAPPSKDARA